MGMKMLLAELMAFIVLLQLLAHRRRVSEIGLNSVRLPGSQPAAYCNLGKSPCGEIEG